jgi:hypothetical protein
MSLLNLSFAQKVKKRFIAAIVSSVLLIVLYAIEYYYFYYGHSGIEFLLYFLVAWLFFIVVSIISSVTLLKNRRSGFVFFAPLVIQVLAVTIIYAVPFYDIFTKINFAYYMEDRTKIVNEVQMGEMPASGGWNSFYLGGDYPFVSTTNRIYIENTPSHKYVSFWIFYPGFLTNSYCAFLYVPEDGSPEDFMASQNPHGWDSERIDANWYHICVSH